MLATLSQSKRKGSGSSSTGDLTKLWLSLGESQPSGAAGANGGMGGASGGGMGGGGGSGIFSGGEGGAGIDTGAALAQRRMSRPKVPKQQSMTAAMGTWRPKG